MTSSEIFYVIQSLAKITRKLGTEKSKLFFKAFFQKLPSSKYKKVQVLIFEFIENVNKMSDEYILKCILEHFGVKKY
jgi:hypothetical protein